MSAPFIMPEPVTLPADVLRAKLARVIADARGLLDLLDEEEGIDPDLSEDMEPDVDGGHDEDADSELTAIENAGRGFYGVEADDAEDDGADEPLLGAPENHPSCPAFSHLYRSREGRQTLWGQGRNNGLNDGEPEAGYDQPEGDEELCASDDVHGEYSLGWTANVSQVRLYTNRERWGGDELEDTALERHGRGFMRSGPDDTEDDERERDEDHGSDDGEDIGHFMGRSRRQPLTKPERMVIVELARRARASRKAAHV